MVEDSSFQAELPRTKRADQVKLLRLRLEYCERECGPAFIKNTVKLRKMVKEFVEKGWEDFVHTGKIKDNCRLRDCADRVGAYLSRTG